MLIDLAVNSFDAEVSDMVDVARVAQEAGCSCVWVLDHFSGAVVGKSWVRDPFVCLGAIGVATDRIELGVLVANVVNRHPAQLASAINSLQSLAPGRVRLGVGSGAAPGSRFAVEHEAVGRQLAPLEGRRRLLVDSIESLRSIWAGVESLAVPEVGFDGLTAVTDGRPCPPIVVGASAWPTVAVALECADGVNLRMTEHLMDHLVRLRDVRPDGFEVSVLDALGREGLEPTALADAGCDRLVLGVSAPFDTGEIGAALAGL